MEYYYSIMRLTLLLGSFFAWSFAVVKAQVPTITNVAPQNGPVGSSVTITGTNFDNSTGTNIVHFGAVQASVTTSSTSELNVTVPYGATYQPVSVTVNNLLAKSNERFTVTFDGNDAIDANTFLARQDETDVGNPVAVELGDLDGDGKIDLVVIENGGSFFSVYRNISTVKGVIELDSRDIVFTNGGNPLDLDLGDYDADGKLDVAISHHGPTVSPSSPSIVSIFRNSSSGAGDISFGTALDITIGINSIAQGTLPLPSIKSADLDRDGKLDIAVNNFRDDEVSVLRNTSSGPGLISFASKEDFATGNGPFSVDVADMDGDQIPDLVVGQSTAKVLSVLRNTSSPGVLSFAAKEDFDLASTQSPKLSLGDIDGDGLTDVAVAHASNHLSVFRNTSTVGTLGMATRMDWSQFSLQVGFSDLNGDGKIEMVSFSNSLTNVFKNISTVGDIVFESPTGNYDLGISSVPVSLGIGDLDRDGEPDLVVPYSGFPIVGIGIFKNARSENDLVAFTLPQQTAPAIIDEANHTVSIEVESGTDVSSLTASFVTSSGVSGVKVGGTDQVSGTTINDFTNPVVYTVIAEDALSEDWTVTVTVAPNIVLVTNLNTSGAGSFHQAMIDAEASAIIDQIRFKNSLIGESITVEVDYKISDDLYINGDINNDGVADITLASDGGTHRFLSNEEGNSAGIEIKLEGVHVTGFNDQGAVRLRTDALAFSLINCTFTGNESTFSGGALNAESQIDLTVIGCQFTANKNGTGGAINLLHASSSASVSTCIFNSNEATFFQGGAINALGTLIVENSLFYENTSVEPGGAVYADQIATFRHITVTDNTSTNCSVCSGFEGGGIAVAGTLNLENSLVVNNMLNGTIDNIGENIGTINNVGVNIIGGTNGAPETGYFNDAAADDYTLFLESLAVEVGDNALSSSAGLDEDLAGNTRPFNGGTVDVGAYEFQAIPDNTGPAPTITLGSGTITESDPVPLVITFDEEVIGFVQTDITLVGGTVTGFNTSDNKVFEIEVTRNSDQTTLSVEAGVTEDAAGNTNSVSNVFEVVKTELSACHLHIIEGVEITESGTYSTNDTNKLTIICLTIFETNETEVTIDNCGSYQFGTQLLNASGIYEETFTNKNGCDSLVTLTFGHLPEPMVEVEVDGDELEVEGNEDLTYQWIDCDTGEPLVGETDDELDAPFPGNFAVEVSNGVCTKRVDCVTVGVVAAVSQRSLGISAYPNPTQDILKIDLGKTYNFISVEILDLSGSSQLLIESRETRFLEVNLESLEGVFLMRIKNNERLLITSRFIKN